jgi:hypothetical protein
MKKEDTRPMDVQVREWLNTEGYPLELEVARAFRKAGFRAHHAMMYDDENTNTKREIDVVATKQFGQDGRWIRVVIAAECKYNAKKPWVCFSDTEHTLNENQRIRQRITGGFGGMLLDKVSTLTSLFNKGLFQIPMQCASSMTAAFKSSQENKDYAYSSATSVMAASKAIAKRFHKSPIAAIVFPVIVVDGFLFQSHLTETGEMELNQVYEAVLLWKNQATEHPNAIINVINSTILQQFVTRCQETADAIFSIDNERLGVILGKPGGDIKADHPSIDF